MQQELPGASTNLPVHLGLHGKIKIRTKGVETSIRSRLCGQYGLPTKTKDKSATLRRLGSVNALR